MTVRALLACDGCHVSVVSDIEVTVRGVASPSDVDLHFVCWLCKAPLRVEVREAVQA